MKDHGELQLFRQFNFITFEIEKPIKNISKNITQITVITHAQESVCGYHFENNTRY